jgi:hypothetical protein
MKSLLMEMNEKFQEIENKCDCADPGCAECNTDEIEEQNVSGAVAGFNTPAAFAKPGKWKSKSVKYESVNAAPSYKHGVPQQPESDEETAQDKFAFTPSDRGMMEDQEYPVKFTNNPHGTANIKDETIKSSRVAEIMEKKYMELIEGYRDFKLGDKKPSHKVKDTIREIAKKLQEIETLVNYNTRLKTESGISSSEYGPAASKALATISSRLTKISERVRALGE